MTNLADRLAEALAAGRAPDLHGVVVMRGGEIALEHYGVGEDFTLGESLGVGHLRAGHAARRSIRNARDPSGGRA